MRLEDYARAISARIKVEFQPIHLSDGIVWTWSAKLQNCEEKDGIALISHSGWGETADEALRDYAGLIRGKRIVFNSMIEEKKQEFIVPNDLE